MCRENVQVQDREEKKKTAAINIRSDTCQKCDHLNNSIAAEENAETKVRLETEKRIHLQKAEVFYAKLREYTNLAREDESVDVLRFDYQQNLPLPHIPSGDAFYKRQLWGYNVCIHSAKKKEATFYIYDYYVYAKKGCNEVKDDVNERNIESNAQNNALPATVTQSLASVNEPSTSKTSNGFNILSNDIHPLPKMT
ncbi:unnamed protein product [Psylliodes chrysocephalus]|uniref:Uncharacterized protein n=1 Tax=Psylliodes chrysocephalus TaxID=3402493 RepID=A0A9P0CI92_9CUCU|nr:unnamed protein product [Psylliodes chrysocephala]